MKKTCLAFSIIVAALVLFTATVVRSACDPPMCFENNDYRVEAVPDANGFPKIVGGNSVFEYQITNIGGKTINKADILIPICEPTRLTIQGSSPSGTLYGPPNYPLGFGDPNTGFGLGLTTYNTFVWSSIESTGKISLTLNGKVSASPSPLLLNRGTSNYAYGQILSPACGTTSSSVPLTTTKVATFGGISVCLESPDQTGCPTKIYSCCTQRGTYTPPGGPTIDVCTAYSETPCGCPSGDQQLYTEVNLGIDPGHLNQVWTDSDPQCPLTFLSIQSIPCYQTIVVNGVPKRYTYYTRPPCL